MWRNYRLSLSFANLVYLRAWADLIPLRSGGLFHRKTLPGFSLYFALAGDVLALSLLIFALVCLAPRLPGWLRRIAPVAAMAAMVLAASFLRNRIPHILIAAIALVLVMAAGLALKYPAAALRAMQGFATAALPCLAVTFLAPPIYLSQPSPLPPDPPLARRMPGNPPVRVVWMVFDDWDQRLTFDDPDVLAPVPVLMELASRSFTAHRALAVLASMVPVPAMATNAAIPSLLYGKLLVGSRIEGPATRQMLFAGSDTPTPFGQGDSIFSRFRANGWNSAIAGWFLPYCRVFAPVVTECYWDEMFDQASSASPTALDAALDESRMLLETEMFSPFGRSLVAERHFSEYEKLVAASRGYAADPSIGLAFIHFNVPHMPFFYNPELGRFGRKGHPNDLYIDELKWVDRAVSETLESLRRSGLDGKTALVISSDHPARLITQTDPHVPYIVHLPGEEAGRYSASEFSAVHTADLILAIARGEVHSPEEVEAFLLHAEQAGGARISQNLVYSRDRFPAPTVAQ